MPRIPEVPDAVAPVLRAVPMGWREVQVRVMQRVERLRAEAGLTQLDLCEQANVGETAYRDYILNRSSPSLKKLWSLADVLGLRVEVHIGSGVLTGGSDTLGHVDQGGVPMTDEAAKAAALLNQIESDEARARVWKAVQEYVNTMGFAEADVTAGPRRVRKK